MLNQRWVIQDRPIGRALRESDFRLETVDAAPLSEGEVCVQTQYLSFDPAQKSWMENIANYKSPTEIGGLMPGDGVGQVVATRSDKIAVGAIVQGPLGWQRYAVQAADQVSVIPEGVPPTAALGVVGMTGKTAYFGLLHMGRPKAGDTLVISGAAGAVGSVVGQIGKIAGCRVIGIAGGSAKCAWLVEELGFDAAIDYKNESVRRRLREVCPNGIDIFFDNVGGDLLNDCLARVNFGARVVICGGISRYNADPRDPQQMPPGPRNYFNVVFTQATIQGFVVSQFSELYGEADRRLAHWVRARTLKCREDVVEGFDQAPRALMRLFGGENFGKQLLKI